MDCTNGTQPRQETRNIVADADDFNRLESVSIRPETVPDGLGGNKLRNTSQSLINCAR